MRPIIRIKLKGVQWLQFDALSIQSSINSLAARCNFRLANSLKLDPGAIQEFAIHKEDEIEIFIFADDDSTGVTIFKGLVTGIKVTLQGTLDVRCATKLMHLETCNHYLPDNKAEKNYLNAWVTDIITDIIKPFDIQLVSEYQKHQLKIVKDYNVSYDETAAQPTPRTYAKNVRMTLFTIGADDTVEMIIKKLCNKVGLIPLDDRKGGLMLVDKHHLQTETTIRQGVNLIGLDYDSGMEGVHSVYHVLSKNAVEIGKKRKKEDSYISVDIDNANAKSYRPKTIHVDALDEDECWLTGAARIKQEMIDAIQFQATVPGWWNIETVIWSPNMVVPCVIHEAEIDGSYTIAGINLLYSSNEGFKTTLDLKPDTVLEYDDPSTYDKTPIEDDDPMAYLNAQKNKRRKRGRKKPLSDPEIDAMKIDNILDSRGYSQ